MSGAASVFERGADDFAVDGFGGIDGNEFQEGGDDVDGVCGFDSRALSESGSAKEEDGILFGKSAMLSAFFSCPAHGVTWHGTDDEISGTIIVAPERVEAFSIQHFCAGDGGKNLKGLFAVGLGDSVAKIDQAHAGADDDDLGIRFQFRL